ncbi:PTS system trehalose-specific IIC component [Chromobacterium alkanivorans]|uniref:PTS system trehalose-specific EIIBC component n=1 Tax=Chromobacterium alkanivorans TaxID=1071719 RepID=UPI001966E7A4|nr:PTS system trehalose-specific EIIBC component [Chromobacterium alkanivorans]MBN3004661.1 PTS system trehalose-specific EIIBC component [Chromobacterium alkanivorans]MCS3804911.1 PTS system trehalose-specific IIC component [Chromobacterium alkanivorans]MCS3819526.1 PTS system trehalose-specific IIC component [Chromobacterium alkanivorans]MCS3874038.1 PTS system trehalose-specific IIC component [Chromobacterium alkanivorans]
MSHDYQNIAARILEAVGGRDNLQQAAHCITRLRLSLKDESRVDQEALRQVELIKGQFSHGGVFQIVIGSGDVDRVYQPLIELAALQRATVAEVKASGDQKQGRLQQLVKVFSDVFMPILPAIIVAGLLMGLNNLLGAKGMFIDGKSLLDAYPGLDGVWGLINMMANTSFVFLPALVGWSAAKRFGGSEVLGIVLGLLLVHPDLLNAWNYGKAAAGLDGAALPYFDVLGWFRIEKVGYQGQILPILAATWVMCRVELWLRPRVPNSVQLLVVPIVTIVVSGVLALAVIGPVARHLGIAITDALVYVFNLAPLLGAMLFGALYAPLVLTGMHHMFIAVDLQLIANQGGTFIWPMIALSNIAQGSAALAMFWLARASNEKSMASTSAISAFFGITEPAMFGVNLRYKLPFYAALAGSALAAATITLSHVRASAIGVGGLPAFISIIPQQIPMFLAGMVVALVAPFALTWVLARRQLPQS